MGHWKGTDGKEYDYRSYPRPEPGDDAEDWAPFAIPYGYCDTCGKQAIGRDGSDGEEYCAEHRPTSPEEYSDGR